MSVLPFTRPLAAPELTETLVCGMMQLSPTGLAEQWLLRDCGDRHWRLIAQALGQTRAVFADASGRAIYAAFCTTALELFPSAPLLGETVEVRSTLAAVSAARIGSEHVITAQGVPVARLRMISAFVAQDGSGSNKQLVRSLPAAVMSLPPAAETLMALDRRARAVRHDLRAQGSDGAVLARLTPVPALDFNAVGLLYFPSFSRLAETARPAAGPLCRRDVVYCGNLDPGETVEIRETGPALTLSAGARVIGHVATLAASPG